MHVFHVYKAIDPKKPTSQANLVHEGTLEHGQNLYREIRRLGLEHGLGKYQIFHEDFGHIHIFQHGWIKRTQTYLTPPD